MVLQRLRTVLPSSWDVSIQEEPSRPNHASRNRPDALVELLSPDGARAAIVLEVKNALEPRDVPVAVLKAREDSSRYSADSILVGAPYLSARTRQRLTEWGANYADATGNLRLALERPAVYLERPGADKNPWGEERPLRSLKGPAAARVVRALCDYRPPVGIRELADRSRASLASVARVVEFLHREAMLERAPRGKVTDVRWPLLLRYWARDYSLVESNHVRTFLEPRGLRALLGKLERTTQRYVITGSLAAAQVAPVAEPRVAAIHVERAQRAATEWGLRPAESGANVLLVEPFDDVIFERGSLRDGIGYAALSQVAADLLTSPGRGPAEGEELIAWMEQNEDAWRA